MEQRKTENISQEIDSKNWIVYGRVRNGKTLLGLWIALDFYPRIYSNFNIYHKGKSIVNLVNTYQRIKQIRFSYTPGILLIDEAGLNANSKDGMSKDSRLLEEILFLCGKKNLSLCWIAQRFESINVNARVLADVIIKTVKIHKRGYDHPVFIYTKQKQKPSGRLEFINSWEGNIIGMMKSLSITYNTLEESKLSKTKDLDSTPIKNRV